MRKYLLFGIGFICSTLALQSCFDDDDDSQILYGLSSIDSVSMPDTARIGEIVKITTYTQIKQKCQGFYSFDYNHSSNRERTVGIIIQQLKDSECGEEITIAPVLNFSPERVGTYTFRFMSGRDSTTNKNIFITKDIYIKNFK